MCFSDLIPRSDNLRVIRIAQIRVEADFSQATFEDAQVGVEGFVVLDGGGGPVGHQGEAVPLAHPEQQVVNQDGTRAKLRRPGRKVHPRYTRAQFPHFVVE